MPAVKVGNAEIIGSSSLKHLDPPLHIHSHLELIYIDKGASLATADRNEYLIEEGDFFLAFPHQIHGYHDLAPALEGGIFIFSADLFKDLKDIFYNKVPVSPIIKSSSLSFDAKERINTISRLHNSDSAFDRIAAKGYLLALLGELLPLMTLVPNDSDQDSIKNILVYCSEHYTDPLSLEQLAKELHLSKYYISRTFQERMHMSFTDFINNMRTEHACNMLEKGVNITEVAFSAGFSSIRNFNRIFHQNMGMTPREYIKMKD